MNLADLARLIALLTTCGIPFYVFCITRPRKIDKKVFDKQKALSTKTSIDLILLHEEKRLKVDELIVGEVYRQVVDFEKDEINDIGYNFIGSFKGLPVMYSPVLNGGDAMAISYQYPVITTTRELKD